jgi:hypothetical protein
VDGHRHAPARTDTETVRATIAEYPNVRAERMDVTRIDEEGLD